jgi:hypothetical protein
MIPDKIHHLDECETKKTVLDHKGWMRTEEKEEKSI